MTFEESQEEKRVTSNESDMWGEMAFVICTKSKQDIKDLLSKVANFEEKPIN